MTCVCENLTLDLKIRSRNSATCCASCICVCLVWRKHTSVYHFSCTTVYKKFPGRLLAVKLIDWLGSWCCSPKDGWWLVCFKSFPFAACVCHRELGLLWLRWLVGWRSVCLRMMVSSEIYWGWMWIAQCGTVGCTMETELTRYKCTTSNRLV